MARHNQEHELQARIRRLIEDHFGAISLTSVVLILEELTADYERRARQRSSSTSAVAAASSSPSSAAPPPASPRPSGALFHSDQPVAEFAEVGVVAGDELELAQLLNQIVHIGALMIQVDEPLSLNEQVSLVMEYPGADFSMSIIGRVVNISARGTALEITKLQRDDRAALEQMYRHYQHHLEPSSLSSSSPASSAPDSVSTGRAAASTQERAPRTRSPRRGGGAALHASSVGSGTAEQIVPFSRMQSTINDSRLSMRRQVSLIEPDEKVITSSNLASDEDVRPSGSMTEEFYGPTRTSLKVQRDPDRVEELAGDRVMDILLQLSGHHFTGLVELEHKTAHAEESIAWRLSFDSGFLVDATREPRQARVELGHMLLLAKRVEKMHLSMAAAHAEEREQPLAQSLLDLDLLEPQRLRHAIAGRLTFLLRLLCNTESGVVRAYGDEKLPAGFLPVPPIRVHVAIERTIFQLIYESLRQKSAEERRRLFEVELDTYPEALSEEYERIQRAVGEDEPLARFIERLTQGRRRLREVFTESALSSADTFAIVFALHRMGLLRFDRSLHHTVVRERFRENVTVKYLSVHKASYFEVLNVHWSSYDEVIQRAYEELLEQFDPESTPEALEPEVHERVREIRDRVKSAYQVLAKREHRHTYRSRIMPEYKLAHAVPLFLKQGELAERRQQWSEARDSVLRVLELKPEHPEAKTRLAQIEARLQG